nr:MAG TPA_asm: hypothetical protein [Caudoviricetes sp.]
MKGDYLVIPPQRIPSLGFTKRLNNGLSQALRNVEAKL